MSAGSPSAALEGFPTVSCPFCNQTVLTFQHPAGVELMQPHHGARQGTALCEGSGRAPR